MAVYVSTHYNLARFLEPVTRDEYDTYYKIIRWFQANKELKGTISSNSLFLLSNLWGNRTILKDLSKLCLTKQIELTTSMYSGLIPLQQDYENEMIKHQIAKSSSVISKIFPKEYVRGYYPPFGIWDKRMSHQIEEEGFKYAIVDWRAIEQSISKKPKGVFEVEFFKPFKLKGHEIYILPSFNLRSMYRNYPETYDEAIKSGEMNSIFHVIENGINISKEKDEDFFGILSCEINDLKYPVFQTNFDFENYLLEANELVKLPINFIRPSEIISKFDEIQEIELESAYSFELSLTNGFKRGIHPVSCCVYFAAQFEEQLENIRKLEELCRSLPENKKQSILQLLEYSWNFLLTIQHNFCFDVFSEPIKGVNFAKNTNIWESVSHLSFINYIASVILLDEVQPANPSFFFENDCADTLYTGDKILCSLMRTGGILTNLVDLTKGSIIISCPSKNLAIDKTTQEPRFGLMYDIVSQKHSGQYNLFHEKYTYDWRETEGGIEISFSTYTIKDVLLTKNFRFKNSTSEFDITYKFTNSGDKSDKFSIHSLSKINLGGLQTHILKTDELVYESNEVKDEGMEVIIKNLELNSEFKIKIPKDVTWKIEKDFGNLELVLRLEIPSLRKNEEKEFTFKFEIS